MELLLAPRQTLDLYPWIYIIYDQILVNYSCNSAH